MWEPGVCHTLFWVHLHNLFPKFISIVSPQRGETVSQIMSRPITQQNTNHQMEETTPLFTLSLSLTLPSFSFLPLSICQGWPWLTGLLLQETHHVYCVVVWQKGVKIKIWWLGLDFNYSRFPSHSRQWSGQTLKNWRGDYLHNNWIHWILSHLHTHRVHMCVCKRVAQQYGGKRL